MIFKFCSQNLSFLLKNHYYSSIIEVKLLKSSLISSFPSTATLVAIVSSINFFFHFTPLSSIYKVFKQIQTHISYFISSEYHFIANPSLYFHQSILCGYTNFDVMVCFSLELDPNVLL